IIDADIFGIYIPDWCPPVLPVSFALRNLQNARDPLKTASIAFCAVSVSVILSFLSVSYIPVPSIGVPDGYIVLCRTAIRSSVPENTSSGKQIG
ncbi:MAG: hypothetical protein UDQ58_08280, partial [Desulfovibrio sp.]|nr:hypothetical protein [Desulfovibrio sp.]